MYSLGSLEKVTSLLSMLTGGTESRVGLTVVMASQEFELFLPKAEMPSRAPADLSYSTLKTSAPGIQCWAGQSVLMATCPL